MASPRATPFDSPAGVNIAEKFTLTPLACKAPPWADSVSWVLDLAARTTFANDLDTCDG